MTEPEDVFEYVDSGVKSFHVRRLLQWLARIRENPDRRISILDVRLSLLLLQFTFTVVALYRISFAALTTSLFIPCSPSSTLTVDSNA